MTKAIYHIGSNNETKELEREAIEAILNAHFEGYTAREVVGYWKGERERTLEVEAITDMIDEKIKAVAAELRDGLKQQAVLVETQAFIGAFI